ncbi:MAG: hypothetical protein IRY94_14655, partial [Rhodospirillaceae bacterium]|nr:hypothetical protein [Rhodospirillaceae bacterium]
MVEATTSTLILAQDAGGAAPAEAGAAAPAPVAEGASVPAAEGAAAAGGETASSVGMPQLDVTTYEPQLVWLGITFILLLVLMWGVALPRVARIMAARERKVSDDLDRAEQMKKEADEALAAYNQAIAAARAKAQEAAR